MTSPPPAKGRPRGAADTRTLSALTALLKAESAQLKAEAARLRAEKQSAPRSTPRSGPQSAAQSPSAGGGASPTAVLHTTSTQLVVTVDLGASSQREAKVGEHVTVEMPAGSIVNATITAVSPVAVSSSNSPNGSSPAAGAGAGAGGSGSAASTVPVTVALRGHQKGAGLDQAAVSVNFAQARARHVLSVPVTALLATSGGHYAVQRAAAPYALIPVSTGLFAAGDVQISGPGIHPGLQVTDSQG